METISSILWILYLVLWILNYLMDCGYYSITYHSWEHIADAPSKAANQYLARTTSAVTITAKNITCEDIQK